MNHALAVDASVAVKWVVAEDLSSQAQALLRDCLQAVRPVIAPPHFTGEVVNAIHRRTQRTEHPLTSEQAAQAVQDFVAVPIELLSPAGLYEQAFTLAQTFALPTIYDSLYVVLAQLLDVELWTADERLRRALRTSAPWVRFIGDYPV
jgi:predicted nucleic acid-binding protein